MFPGPYSIYHYSHLIYLYLVHGLLEKIFCCGNGINEKGWMAILLLMIHEDNVLMVEHDPKL